MQSLHLSLSNNHPPYWLQNINPFSLFQYLLLSDSLYFSVKSSSSSLKGLIQPLSRWYLLALNTWYLLLLFHFSIAFGPIKLYGSNIISLYLLFSIMAPWNTIYSHNALLEEIPVFSQNFSMSSIFDRVLLKLGV